MKFKSQADVSTRWRSRHFKFALITCETRTTTAQLYPNRDTFEFDQGHVTKNQTNHSLHFADWKSRYITMCLVVMVCTFAIFASTLPKGFTSRFRAAWNPFVLWNKLVRSGTKYMAFADSTFSFIWNEIFLMKYIKISREKKKVR